MRQTSGPRPTRMLGEEMELPDGMKALAVSDHAGSRAAIDVFWDSSSFGGE